MAGTWRDINGEPAVAETNQIAWSPNNPFIIIIHDRSSPALNRSVTNLVQIPANGGKAETLLGSKWRDRQPAYSPDGMRPAFISNRSGYNAVWIITIKTSENQ